MDFFKTMYLFEKNTDRFFHLLLLRAQRHLFFAFFFRLFPFFSSLDFNDGFFTRKSERKTSFSFAFRSFFSTFAQNLGNTEK